MVEIPISSIRIDGGTQPRASLDQNVIQEYAQDMLLGVAFPPVTLFYDGTEYWLADGFHRYHGAKQICREVIDAEIKQGTRRDAVLYSVGTNSTHGLRRTNADKRRAVETLLNDPEWARWSDREIARRCGVSNNFVSELRSLLSSDDSEESRTYVNRHGSVATMNITNIGQQQNLTSQQFIDEVFPGFTEQRQDERVQRFEQWQRDNVELGLDEWGDVPPAKEEARENTYNSSVYPLEQSLYGTFVQAVTPSPNTTIPEIQGTLVDPTLEEKEKRDAHVMRVMGSSDSPEWYTPQGIIDLVCEMFETIDTDPCSNSHETPTVPAQILYTKDDDGLAHIWTGKTYLNPPYGSEIGKWTEKLIAEYKQGNVTEALALLPARIDTVWFSPLYEYLMCNVRGRIQFANSPYSAPFPCIIVYLGTRLERFVEVFNKLGPIMHRIG